MIEDIFIEKIVKSRIAGNCVLILSNGENIMATIDSVMQLNLLKGSVITFDIIESIRNILKTNKLKSYAMRLSEGFSRSEKQIREKLKQKGYDTFQIDDSIVWLKEMKLIDDLKFCDNFVRYAINKKWGRNKTRQELRTRGVFGFETDNILNEYYDNTDTYETAFNLAEKKLKLLEKKIPIKQKDAIIRHLLSKGYDYELIINIIKKLF